MLKIEIRCEEHENDKGKWYSYKGFTKKGKKIDVRFRTEVQNAPRKVGVYTITVNESDVNISKARKFPCLWVGKILAVEEGDTQSKKRNEEELKELFSVCSDDDLPF